MKNFCLQLFSLILFFSGFIVNAFEIVEQNRLFSMDKKLFINSNIDVNGEKGIIYALGHNWQLVFDVGANIGEWSATIYEKWHPEIIYGFEPIPIIYNDLVNNLKSFHGYTPVNLGLSNKEKFADLYYYPFRIFGGSSLYFRPILQTMFSKKYQLVEVELTTIDRFCMSHEITEIDFVKIDVEGEEYNVLLGANDLLSKGAIKGLQFEYGGCFLDGQVTLRSIVDLLSSHNYHLYKIFSKGVVKLDTWDDRLEDYEYANFLALIDPIEKLLEK